MITRNEKVVLGQLSTDIALGYNFDTAIIVYSNIPVRQEEVS